MRSALKRRRHRAPAVALATVILASLVLTLSPAGPARAAEGAPEVVGSIDGNAVLIGDGLSFSKTGATGLIGLAGDWDCNGVDSVGRHDPSTATVALTNSNAAGAYEITATFGNSGDLAIAGDFDGDGCDTIALRRGTSFFVANTLNGTPDIPEFSFGETNDLAFSGDFDGDGTDELALYRNGTFFIGGDAGTTVVTTQFDAGAAGDIPVAGDWNGDGTDTVGLYRPSSAEFFIWNANAAGPPDQSLVFGAPGSLPIAGSFAPAADGGDDPPPTTTTMPAATGPIGPASPAPLPDTSFLCNDRTDIGSIDLSQSFVTVTCPWEFAGNDVLVVAEFARLGDGAAPACGRATEVTAEAGQRLVRVYSQDFAANVTYVAVDGSASDPTDEEMTSRAENHLSRIEDFAMECSTGPPAPPYELPPGFCPTAVGGVPLDVQFAGTAAGHVTAVCQYGPLNDRGVPAARFVVRWSRQGDDPTLAPQCRGGQPPLSSTSTFVYSNTKAAQASYERLDSLATVEFDVQDQSTVQVGILMRSVEDEAIPCPTPPPPSGTGDPAPFAPDEPERLCPSGGTASSGFVDVDISVAQGYVSVTCNYDQPSQEGTNWPIVGPYTLNVSFARPADPAAPDCFGYGGITEEGGAITGSFLGVTEAINASWHTDDASRFTRDLDWAVYGDLDNLVERIRPLAAGCPDYEPHDPASGPPPWAAPEGEDPRYPEAEYYAGVLRCPRSVDNFSLTSEHRGGVAAVECTYVEDGQDLTYGTFVGIRSLPDGTFGSIRVGFDRAADSTSELCRETPNEYEAEFLLVVQTAVHPTHAMVSSISMPLQSDRALWEAARDEMYQSVLPLAKLCGDLFEIQLDPVPSRWEPVFGTGGPASFRLPDSAALGSFNDEGRALVRADIEAGGTGSTATEPAASDTDTGSEPQPVASTESNDLWRIISIGGIVLSILGVGMALLFARKRSRVRPRWDQVRLGISVVTVAVMTFIIGIKTPWLWIGIGVGVGVVLGLLQGRNLKVSVTEKGLYAQRTLFAVMAFSVGIILVQIAGFANRAGVVAIGLGVTVLSAAMTAGIVVGRRPRIAEARAIGTAVAVLVLGAALVGSLLATHPTAAQTDDAIYAELIAADPAMEMAKLVNWDQITLDGGAWQSEGKPTAMLAIPPALTGPPPELARTVDWTSPFLDSEISYQLTETFSFVLGEDDVCCVIDYVASGTKTTPRSDGDEVEALEASATVGVVSTSAQRGFTAGLPFRDPNFFGGWAGTEQYCGREVAEAVGQDRMYKSYTLNGEAREMEFETRMLTECEIDGIDLETALAVAPPPLAPDDEGRIEEDTDPVTGDVTTTGPCPVYQEIVGELAGPTGLNKMSMTGMAQLYRDPNASACRGALSFGSQIRGEPRVDLFYNLATESLPRESSRIQEVNGDFYGFTRQGDINEDSQCPRDADGNVIAPGDGGNCIASEYFTVNADTAAEGQVYVSTWYVLPEGPDTDVYGRFPWGSYHFLCHHCEPDDPRITATIDRWHVLGALTSPAFGSAAGNTALADVLEGSELDEQGANDLIDLLIDDSDDIDARAAALTALIGMLGIGGVAASTFLEASGIAPVDEAPQRPAFLDENGQPMSVADGTQLGADGTPIPEGMVLWEVPDEDPVWLDPEDARERIQAELDARRDNEAFRSSSRVEWDSDRESAALSGRTMAEEQEWLEQQAAIHRPDRMSRDELIAALEIAEAEQAGVENNWWGSAWDHYWDGVVRDTDSLQVLVESAPGAVVDATRATVLGAAWLVEQATDGENWTIVYETGRDTAVSAIGILQGRTEGIQQAAEGFSAMGRGGAAVVRGGGQLVGAVGSAFARDPWGFVVALTPIDPLSRGLDPDQPIGSRIGNLWMAAADVGLTVFTAGTGRVALEGAEAIVDTARVVDRIGDAAETGLVAGRLEDATAAARAAARAEHGSDGARAAREAAEAQRASLVDDAIASGTARRELDPDFLARRQAFVNGQARGQGRIDDFVAALDSGDPDAIHAATLAVQSDKGALQAINRLDDSVKGAFNAQMRGVYGRTDEAMVAWARNSDFGDGIGPIVRETSPSPGVRVFEDAAGNRVIIAEPTNPSDIIKVGADRDYTMRIQRAGDAAPVDIPSGRVQSAYDDAFFEAAGGPEAARRLGIPEDAASFTQRMDQVATDARHLESYTDLETALRGAGVDFTDPQQIANVMEFKSEHWYALADKYGAGNPALREDFIAEGMRQATKQFDNQVMARMDTLADQMRAAGLTPPVMDTRLEAAMDILKKVNPKTPGVPRLSPAEAEAALSAMGLTPQQVYQQSGQMIETMQTLAPRNADLEAMRDMAGMVLGAGT